MSMLAQCGRKVGLLDDLDLFKPGRDGGACDNPGVASPQAGGHLCSHTTGGGYQLGLIQNHPPEPKLQ